MVAIPTDEEEAGTTAFDNLNENIGDIEDPLARSDEVDDDEPLVRTNQRSRENEGTQKKKCRTLYLLAGFGVLLLVLVCTITAVVLTRDDGDNSADNTKTSASSLLAEGETTTGGTGSVPDRSGGTGFVATRDEAGELDDPEDADQGTSVKPPFDNVELPVFSKEILDGYASKEDFEADLTNALKSVVNNLILTNIERHDAQIVQRKEQEEAQRNATAAAGGDATGEEEAIRGGEVLPTPSGMMMQPMQMRSKSLQKKSKKAAPTAVKSESKQAEDGMDTEKTSEDDDYDFDVLVGDDDFVYAAYGEYLFVWDQEGTLVQELKMGATDETENPRDPWGWGPSSHINALVVTDDHLAVVSQRYGDVTMTPSGYGGFSGRQQEKTYVEFFTKPSKGETLPMTLVGSKKLTGRFGCGSWSKDSNQIHIVTTNWISNLANFWELDVFQFPWMSREDYSMSAGKVAEERLIPTFVKTMSDMLFVDDTIPQILKLSQWDPEATNAARSNMYFDIGSILGTYTQVAFIDVSTVGEGDGNVDDELSAPLAGYFGPHSMGCNAADDWLVLSTGSSSYFADGTMHASSFLISLKASTKAFHSVAMFEGNLANNAYSMVGKGPVDIQGNDARIALTIQDSNQDPYMRLFSVCGDPYYSEDGCINFENYANCSTAVMECKGKFEKKGGCPYTEFVCEDDDASEPVSSTQNFVVTLDMDPEGDMKEHGRVQIGGFDERITSVLFNSADGLAYATTYEEMANPMMMFGFPFMEAPTFEAPTELNQETLYVLDVSESQAPTIKSQALTRLGYSGGILLPAVPLLLSVARDMSNVDGSMMNGGRYMPGSLMLTVFDVSDPEAPSIMTSQKLNTDDEDSSSEAEYLAEAVSFYEDKLVIPVEMHPSQQGMMPPDMDMIGFDENMTIMEGMTPPPMMPLQMMPPSPPFRGFLVFDLGSMVTASAEAQVDELFRIDHATTPSCYCGGRFQSRSYVFDASGVLVTVSGNSAIGTNLEDGAQLWMSEANPQGAPNNCCYY